MVPVTIHHAFQVIHSVRVKDLTEVQRAVAPFVIQFVYHDEPHFVAQVIQHFTLGIVAAAYRVAAHFLKLAEPLYPD